jgi:hypothetical protein
MHLLLVLLTSLPAAPPELTGSVKGQVVDARTQAPLAAVSVSIEGMASTATTDALGAYALGGIPVGSHNLVFRHDGCTDLLRSDVVVRSARTTFVNVALSPSLWRHEEHVVIDASEASERQQVDVHELAAPELRRTAPGGDLSRALYVLPGVVQADDGSNDLTVRGGSSTENGYYIDNIPVPNINHFPQEGASGGGISMLDLDFVDDVQVLTGGFGASYGDRLSSIVDIHWREGDRSAVKGRLDLNMLGFGGGAEGPIPGGKGSWMVSAKHSYMDLIAGSLNLGSIDLRFSDVQGKVVYDLGPRHRLTLIDIYGQSSGTRDETKAAQSGESQGHDRAIENTAGLNWRALWGARGFSDTSFSYAFIDNQSSWLAPGGAGPVYRRNFDEAAFTLRSINRLQLAPRQRLEFGIEASRRSGRAFNMLSQRDVRMSNLEGSAFAAYGFTGRLSGSLGLRVGRDPFNGQGHLEPRLSASYAAGERLTFNVAFGRYSQTLPFALVKQVPANRHLASLEATHYVAGAHFRLRGDLRLTLEVYAKEYRHFPMSPDVPNRFVIDDVTGNDRSFWDYGTLVDSGRAYSRGIELMLHKTLTKQLYGVVSGSLFRARYQDLTGTWRNRIHDNQFVASITGGYRPDKYWDLTARWLLAGGKGSTPYNVWSGSWGSSADLAWDRWMTTHLPPYQTLGLRVDRRAYFRRASLAAYFAVWNVLDRQNVRYYYWNAMDHQLQVASQWGLIPYLGIEIQF